MITRKILAGALAAGAIVIAAPAAHAAADDFRFCWPSVLDCVNGTSGTITWGDRTTSVTGSIWHRGASGASQVQFRAIAGGHPVGQTTRGATPATPETHFKIQHVDQGVDRIDVRFCSPSLTRCQPWKTFEK